MANNVLRYVDMVGGVALAGTAVGISLSELYKGTDGKLPAAPMSVVLTLLFFAAAGMIMTSLISILGMYTSTIKDDLVKQALSYHRRLAGVLVLITAVYAGLELKGKAAKCGESEEEACDALFSGTLSYGEGLFLGALIYKGLDSVVDAVVTFFYYEKEESKDQLVSDRRMNDIAGLAALALSLILFLVYQGEDDVFDKYEKDAEGKWHPTFKNTTITEEDGKVQKQLIQLSMVFSIIVLGVVALLTSFSNSNRILVTVGTLSSAFTHAVAGLLAVQVGQFFHVQAYATGDTSFLPSNFFYLGAVLLAFFAARHFDSKDRTEEDGEQSDKVRLAMGAFVISFGIGLTALFGIRDLYHKIQYEGDITGVEGFTKEYKNVTVGTKNVTVGNVTSLEDVIEKQLVEAEGPIASEAREIAMYVLVIVAYIGLHTIAVKITELLIKSGANPIGICKNAKADEDETYTTQRSNLSLMFALTTAVLFGSRVAQGPATAIADSAIASIWITWLLAALGRGISFLGIIAAGELDSLFWNSKAVRIFTDASDYAPLADTTGRLVSIPCLNAVISLVLSAIFFTVHITNKQHFFGSDVGTEESTWDGVFLFIAWLGVLAHVVFTLIGIFAPKLESGAAFHAGTIPLLRFAVSSWVLFALGISVGQGVVLNGHTSQYSFWAFVLYLTYDVYSRGKF